MLDGYLRQEEVAWKSVKILFGFNMVVFERCRVLTACDFSKCCVFDEGNVTSVLNETPAITQCSANLKIKSKLEKNEAFNRAIQEIT